MLDPREVYVAVPAYDGKIVVEQAGSLLACSRMIGNISFKPGISHVSVARNIIAHSFLKTEAQWLICIDSDIAFAPHDLALLLEPTVNIDRGLLPTRVACRQVDQDEETGTYHAKHDLADCLVCAEYSYKNDALAPVKFGLGFTRIHRGVFEAIANLRHEDGSPRAWQFLERGEMITDYYPSGPFLASMLPQPVWKGEDHGFFALCHLAGIIPRIETRTRLHHIGVKAYPYLGPDRGGGQ